MTKYRSIEASVTQVNEDGSDGPKASVSIDAEKVELQAARGFRISEAGPVVDALGGFFDALNK